MKFLDNVKKLLQGKQQDEKAASDGSGGISSEAASKPTKMGRS